MSQKTIELLDTGSLDDPVSQEVVDELLAFSEETRLKSMAAGKYTGFPFRYEGELRSFGPNLVSAFSLLSQCSITDTRDLRNTTRRSMCHKTHSPTNAMNVTRGSLSGVTGANATLAVLPGNRKSARSVLSLLLAR